MAANVCVSGFRVQGLGRFRVRALNTRALFPMAMYLERSMWQAVKIV